jgi:hypothetical protein
MTQLCVNGQTVLNIPERDISKQIVAALRYSGWLVIKNFQTFGSYKGLSDFTIIRDGEVIFLEIKRMNGKQSAYQKTFEHDIEEHGGRYFIARSLDDIEDLTIGYIKF